MTLHAEPGPLARFGPIEIQGNTSVSDHIVRRQLTYRPGQLFRQSKLLESQRRLYTPGAVRVRERRAAATGRRSRRDSDARHGHGRQAPEGELRPRLRQRGEARVQIDWRHVNFFGGARTAGRAGALLGAGSRRAAQLHRAVFLRSATTTSTLTGQSWHTDEPAFTLDTNGGRVTVTRQFGRGSGPVLRSRPTTTPVVHLRERVRELHDLRGGAGRSDVPRRADRARPRSRASADGSRACARRSASTPAATRPTTCSTRKGYVAAIHLEQAGEVARAATTTTTRSRSKRATTVAVRSASSPPRRRGRRRSTRSGRPGD